MKRFSSLSFVALVTPLALFGAGCAKTEVPHQTSSAAAPQTMATSSTSVSSSTEASAPQVPELSAEDAAWITKNIKAGSELVSVGRPASWHIPAPIVPAQFHIAYQMTYPDSAFGFVQQLNANHALLNDDGTLYQGPVSFAGVVFTSDRGQTWQRVFRIPTSGLIDAYDGSSVRLNPVGMFLHQGRYALDLIDDHGAGSGEGNLVRFWTTDGRTWARDPQCYYFIAEQYYDPNPAMRSAYDPPGGNDPILQDQKILPEKCPSYMLKLTGT